MSFIVSGIDIPKSCYECILEFTFFKHCNCGKLEGITEKDKNGLNYTESRHPNCPLKEDVDLAIFLNEVKLDGLLNDGKYPSTIFDWLNWLREGGNCV